MKRTLIQPLKVVDDFLEAPTLWRDYALRLDYTKDQSGYPGVKSKTLDELDAGLFHSLASKLSQHTGDKKNFERLKVNFVSAVENDNPLILGPHQDELFYNVAGVVYLNEQAPKNTGTSFYGHYPSGFVKTITVENVFNRLVIFHPSMWHAPDGFFGNAFENSRLIITIFGIAV